MTQKQTSAARKNIKKAQAAWKHMTKRARTLAQPQGRGRAKPGSTGKGKFYRIVVRPKDQFTSFRVQDVGEKGGLERLAWLLIVIFTGVFPGAVAYILALFIVPLPPRVATHETEKRYS